jgi:hypothetical protein
MNNTDTLATSDTQDTGQYKLMYPMLPVSLCCSFLIVPSVYSCVYFVLCLVYPMLPVSLDCLFLTVPSVYSSVYFVLCLVYPMLPVCLCCSLLIDPSVYSGVYFVLFLKTEGTIKNEQHRDIGNIGYIRHRTK